MVNQRVALIGGGSGFIGNALRLTLKGQGFHVKIVSRSPGPDRLTWTDIVTNGLPSNCNVVVNTAGQNVFDISRRWTTGFKQNVIASRVNTTLNLARAIDAAEKKPDVFISLSGVGYYKPSFTEEYTEDSPGGNFDFLSKLATDWENATELKTKGVRTVIIRSGVVLGREGGMINQMFWPFYFGLGGPVGSGKQYFPWIHIADMIGIMTLAIDNPKVSGVINGVAPHIITNKQFSKAFGKALWRPALIPMPTFVLNQAFSAERAKIMTEGQKVTSKRLSEFGYKFRYPDIESACKTCTEMIYLDHLMQEELKLDQTKR